MGQDLSVILKRVRGVLPHSLLLGLPRRRRARGCAAVQLRVGEALPRGHAGVGAEVAETYGDKNGYNARKRRKSDAGYIHGGGSGVVQRKATPVTARPTPPLKPALGALLAPCARQRLATKLGGLPHRKCHGCLHRATPALLAPRWRCRAVLQPRPLLLPSTVYTSMPARFYCESSSSLSLPL